jgi:uncharacterized membrane protein
MSGCHDAITKADGYDFTTYQGIMVEIRAGDPTSGKIMREINRGSMPQSPVPQLTSEQKSLLERWIREGAKNRVCSDPCNPSSPSFAATVQPLINTNCKGCHNPSLPSGGVSLNDYTEIKSSALTGKLLCSIQHQAGCSAMPKGTAKLSNNCIQMIQNWVNNGAPNN